MVRFCCNFKRNHQYMDIIDEINIVLDTESILDLEVFLDKHQKQRVNLCVPSYKLDAVRDFAALENRSNLYIRFDGNFNFQDNQDLLDFLKENNMPYYFKIVADDWDKFNGMAAAGVCDIYVGNALGFQLKDVKKKATSYGVNIRVYPNVAQASWDNVNGITKFFVRPEDAIFYSSYVDCFEFYELPDSPLTNTEVLYEIYKFDKRWLGPLNAIILFLREEVENRLVDTDLWATTRLNCKKSCAAGGPCAMCYRVVELTDALSEKEQDLHNFLTT